MGINRRKFLKSVGLGTIMLGAQPLTALASEALVSDSSSQDRKDITDDGPQVQIGDHIAIADTEYGKVKGYIMRGIYTFLGIPYAADTSGKNRFMPPCKHKPWTGVRPAVFYGNTAPQDVYSRASTSYDMFVDHWNYDEISENCLCLNIWTQGIADGKKRPVVVWLHGGGFTRGNGIEQDGYNGENITRYGDIVYCSINHRLGVFGFTDLSDYENKAGFEKIDMLIMWSEKNDSIKCVDVFINKRIELAEKGKTDFISLDNFITKYNISSSPCTIQDREYIAEIIKMYKLPPSSLENYVNSSFYKENKPPFSVIVYEGLEDPAFYNRPYRRDNEAIYNTWIELERNSRYQIFNNNDKG